MYVKRLLAFACKSKTDFSFCYWYEVYWMNLENTFYFDPHFCGPLNEIYNPKWAHV